MSLLLTAAAPRSANLYIETTGAVAQADGSEVVDVIVGNRGNAMSRENFDALLEAASAGKTLCRSTTNFVTPIEPGESIRALRFELRPAGSRSLQRYTIRATARFWDRSRPQIEKQVIVALPPGAARCVSLKPIQ